MSVRFGAFVPQGWRMDLAELDDPVAQFEAVTRVAKVADEETRFDAIWVYDHFHTVPEPALETTFECWTITATLARDTRRVHIGQMVSCNGYRNPALFAKIASTVDVASHGRLYAGFGAGWHEHEWRAYGYGFPEVPERMHMFREAVVGSMVGCVSPASLLTGLPPGNSWTLPIGLHWAREQWADYSAFLAGVRPGKPIE